MGQYYKIVNLDRHQYLTPWHFGDGAKLMEFGASADGVMTALAVLLSDGCGRGGGDLHILDDQNGEEANEMFAKQGWRKPSADAASLLGSWAGDRVVIAGDYADAGRWKMRTNFDGASLTWHTEAIPASFTIPRVPDKFNSETEYKCEGDNANLFNWLEAPQSGFEDISYRVLALLAADPYMRDAIAQRLSWRAKEDQPAWLNELIAEQDKATLKEQKKIYKELQKFGLHDVMLTKLIRQVGGDIKLAVAIERGALETKKRSRKNGA